MGNGIDSVSIVETRIHLRFHVEINIDYILIYEKIRTVGFSDPITGTQNLPPLTPCLWLLLLLQLLEVGGGRLVLALEGGYNLSSIAASYAACVAVLLGEPPMPDWPARYPRKLKAETPAVLKEVRWHTHTSMKHTS